MEKIPTLFERKYENHKVVGISPKTTPGMEWVLNGEGVATVKFDGVCCAIINGELYKRYDAKKGRKVPEGAIKCQDKPDPVTGHLPCWVKCERGNKADKWLWAAHDNLHMFELRKARVAGTVNKSDFKLNDGTYEAIGKHFQGNSYNMLHDALVPHGEKIVEVERTFEGIKKYLSENRIEGIVFWKAGKPQCKIKRSDFGLDWN